VPTVPDLVATAGLGVVDTATQVNVGRQDAVNDVDLLDADPELHLPVVSNASPVAQLTHRPEEGSQAEH
jgi:hypothetical protein